MASRVGGATENKAQRVTREVGRAVSAGKTFAVETVDFSDPNRPKTCLEVDFPILPVNQVAAIEGNASKPIYQMSKWWARRRSSVFRTTLLAASIKAPADGASAAKAVWDVYYGNHRAKRTLENLKVADIFMGGGTTIVEGSRLGMQMSGADINPVAWFVVRNQMAANVTRKEIEALLAAIEAEVRPQVMPFYACSGPNGERGIWTRISTGEVMGPDFSPLALSPEDRRLYAYQGPQMVYTFWGKHGPCQVTGCGHRTPILPSPVVAVKEISIKAWEHACPSCGIKYDVEACSARMAPDVPLVLAEGEPRFAVLGARATVVCPACAIVEASPHLGKSFRKKVSLTLLTHPSWLEGEGSADLSGQAYGGSLRDAREATSRWWNARAKRVRLLEVRGALPESVTCPETGTTMRTDVGTVPKDAHFACAACGKLQRIVESLESSGKTAPVAPFVIQGYSAKLEATGAGYSGRFFAPVSDSLVFEAAESEWNKRKDADLASYWPRSEIPFGHMTHQRQPLPAHGYLRWADMFNSRQLLLHALLLKAIAEVGGAQHRPEARDFVLGAFQQYLQAQNMMCWWNIQTDRLAVSFSSNNFHPKATVIEGGFPWGEYGHSIWSSCARKLLEALEWRDAPHELLSVPQARALVPEAEHAFATKSIQVSTGDRMNDTAQLHVASATDLAFATTSTMDLVITDPPFGGLLQYSELSDFFYVWLRLALKGRFPDLFSPEYTPKTLEAVANKARHPEDADAYYQRLLTASWREAHRILKPGGTLAFTFHHSEDAPWVSVLESLFDAGFYLEATYPIRGDEAKGDGDFGSKKIEFDIIHVCRKRVEDPTAVSWAKMRRQVLQDVRALKEMLEHHQKEGLPEADLQVIRRGKALEYFSRHYGKVLIDDNRAMTVLEALVGINQLLDEESGQTKEVPPVSAEPFTRQLLRLFDGVVELPRDQMQKFLRGTGLAPSDFETRGWCKEEKKAYHLVPVVEIARAWQGKHRRGMVSDYDQAAVLVGACVESSGINATETLNNENFKPHPALGALLQWLANHSATADIRAASSRALTLYASWQGRNQPKVKQLALFFDDGVSA